MKENTNGRFIKEKSVFAIIYTNKYYEEIAEKAYKLLRKYKRSVYKLFLKDVNYERLISIDSIECIVLIECPSIPFTIDIHIPVISLFSMCRGIDDQWTNDYSRNQIKIIEKKEKREEKVEKEENALIFTDNTAVSDILVKRDFQGVPFKNKEEKEENALIFTNNTAVSDILVKRDFQGVPFKNKEEDFEIHEGRRGIAGKYENEQNDVY
ncbi:hypothetical protein NUSPORA_02306 [Nucleospora cyclopteri]